MVTVSYAAEGRYEAGPGARYRRTHDASVSGYYGHEYRYEISALAVTKVART